ncbi:transport and Golgi organization protein 6 [Biomphalaria glabrata]|uniref:Transport and Golgi organization protein 6 homolog isoform X1 n=1 Tax=Biomphalaria glabrata TaxID=6526 RepID=A0A9W3AY50_BIOGL|nr:transport and Golgi organization protein 6 homolog isoform X1 [Biomphalaria glabrata]KAI8762607.1 putative transport and Golgi organization protein 6 [Biomphalaria glabrata]
MATSIAVSTNQLIIESLKILTSPGGSKYLVSEDGSEELLNTVLQMNLKLFLEFLSKNPSLLDNIKLESNFLPEDMGQSFQACDNITVRQKYAEIFTVLLNCLRRNVSNKIFETNLKGDINKESGLADDALSVQQEKIISTSLQFLLVLGIYPYLPPGVGIPVSQRLGPGQIFLATANDYSSELNDLQRIRLILPIIKLFCDLFSVPSLQSLIVNNYLSDVLTALIYLRHCAKLIMKRTDFSVKTSVDDTAINKDRKTLSLNDISQEVSNQNADVLVYPITKTFMNIDPYQQPWSLLAVIKYTNINIDLVIRSSSASLVLKSLMILSGAGKASSLTPKTPPWFRRIIAGIMKDVLMVPPGVLHFISSFIAESASSNSNSQDWQNCKAVAQIISRCPVNDKNMHQFFTSVCHQLIDLLQSAQIKSHPLIIRAVGATISEVNLLQPVIMKDVCLSHLHSPLLRLASNQGLSSATSDFVLPETVLTSCIETLHKLYIIGQEPQSPFLKTLFPVVGILFSLFVFIRSSHCNLRTLCCDLVKSYLTACDTNTGISCLMALVLQSTETYPCVSQNVKLIWGSSGGVEAIKSEATEKHQEMSSWTLPVDAALDIISSLDNPELISDLFIHLLQKLTEIISAETLQVGIVLPGISLAKDQQSAKLDELKKKIVMISFLASLGEKFGENVIQSCQHVLLFTKVTLERCLKVCQSSDEEKTQMFEWETVSMALSLLTAVLGGAVQLTEQDKQLLDELVPILTALHQNQATDPMVKEMAEDLKIAVATRGLVWGELNKSKRSTQKSGVKQMSTSSKSTQSLIEVLSETNIDDESPNDVENSHQMTDVHHSTKVQQALQDLCDPLLPVRGHGLISLSRLVEDRDPEALNKSKLLLRVFQENLTHNDSYIYLAAVNGLASLSDLDPKMVIACLTTEFKTQCLASSVSSIQTVLKVGEAVVKATRRLGELTPHYRDVLLTAMLIGCRHGDSLVRASSLSGMAEICKLLRYAVGPVLHEIVTCCRDVINSDPDPEPRKAAALTLSQLIQGFGRDALKALEDVLLDIYRTLKLCLAHDKDEKVQLNVHLALTELDTVMKEVLFAKPELKKTITILGYQ